MGKAKVIEAKKTREQQLEVMGEQIDRLITLCVRPRYQWGATPKLWEAAFKKAGRPLTLAAAESLMKLKRGDVVAISTGWPIPPVYATGEICGLAGVASLARALAVGLGVRTLFVTEKESIPSMSYVAQKAELRVWDYDVWDERPNGFAVSYYDFPKEDEAAKVEAKKLIDRFDIKAVICVEKNGVSETGVHCTGLGEDMGPYTAHVEHLVNEARSRGILTIGMGDVGNEIGFGNIHDEAAEIIKPYGKESNHGKGGGIIDTTIVDHLVVASASNRACYGVAACLSALLRNPKVLHNKDIQTRMMDAARDFPVYDSITVRNTFTEDGSPGELTLDMFDFMNWFIEAVDWSNPMFEEARAESGW